MCKWHPHGKWGCWIIVKENAPELVKNKYVDEWVYMSSVSDAYQPIEKELKLTRKVLENMNKKIKLSILTKSELVIRDIEIFKRFEIIEVGVTVNGFSDKIKSKLEPHASFHKKRIDVLKKLNENRIPNYCFISPVIPDLVDIEVIIKETKNFVDKYWIEVLNLRASGYEFKTWLKENYPESYEILVDKQKLEHFIKKIREIIKREKINVEGTVLHNPRFVILK
jgi:DNA repair photolyase